MSREIKFRFWDRANQCWLNPDEAMIYGNGAVAWDGQWVTGEIDVVRFTGLTDKNGKEIFEGDIVEYKNEKATVMFGLYNNGEHYEDNDAGYGFYLMGEHLPYTNPVLGLYFANDGRLEHHEVIGNIYESPELLKE